MFRSFRLIAAVSLLLVAAALPIPAEEQATKEEPALKPVTEWLLLGPVAEVLPAFADDKKRGFTTTDVLKSEHFSTPMAPPAVGETVSWFSGKALEWRNVTADNDGLVPLTASADAPATAWFAAHLTAERWVSVAATISGDHPHRVLLDGVVLSCEAGAEPADDGEPGSCKATLELSRGTHLLLLKTVFDTDKEKPWNFGLALESTKPEALDALTITLDPRRDLGILDVLEPPRITSMVLAPAGDLVALSLRRVVPGTSDSEAWVEVRRTADSEVVRRWRGAQGIEQLQWAPNGTRLSYVTRSGEKNAATLWVDDLEGGTLVSPVERIEDWGGYEWSPTGDAVVYWTDIEEEKDSRGIKMLRGLLDRLPNYRTTSSLYHATVPAGTKRRLTSGHTSTNLAAIAPDGKRLLFTRTVETFEARPYHLTELWEMDLHDMQAKKLRDWKWLSSVEYAPDGERLLVTGGPTEFAGAGVAADAGPTVNEFDTQLYIWNPESDQVQAITRAFDPSVRSARWSRHDGQIYLSATDTVYRPLFRLDPSTGAFSKLDLGVEMVDAFAVAEAAPVAVAYGTSVWQPQTLLAVDLSSLSSRTLLQPAANRFETIRRGEVRPWNFTTSAGSTVEGHVYLPPGFDEERRYPALVYFYAGTSPVDRSFGGRYPKEWWAAQGYVVYVVNPVGCTGWGQKASAAHVNDWGKITIDQIIEGTQAFIDAHPFVDPERLGCLGASYGGFATMSLITRTDLFAAAVSHAGISALSSYWGEGYWGYSYGAVANADSFPWNRPDLFVEHSPLFAADKITTPLLLTHGTADPNVPPGESDQLFIALKLLGKPVEYLQVADLQHWIMEHDKRIVWSESIVAWFDKWLKDQPEWWGELHGSAAEEE